MSEARSGGVVGGCRLEAVIGRGGMGVVYSGVELRSQRRVAVKVIAGEVSHDPEFRDRFARESRLAAAVSHPHIVPVFEAGEVEGQLYLVMEMVEGPTLRELIERRGPLDVQLAIALVVQVASGLDAAHAAGLIHRDVKPANVLLAEQGPGLHAYLSDFGLAKQTRSLSGVTRTGRWVGTLDYAAPEQIQNRPDIDRRADVYSLGCVLYQALTGELPFPAGSDFDKMQAHVSSPPPTVSHQRPDVPLALDLVVNRALAKEPARRFDSAGSLAENAAAAARGEPVDGLTREQAVPPAESEDRPVAIPPRRWALALTAGAPVMLAIIALGLVLGGVFSGSGGQNANALAAARTLSLASSAAGLTNQLGGLAGQLRNNPTPARRQQLLIALAANQQKVSLLRSRARRALAASGGVASPIRQAITIVVLVTGHVSNAGRDLTYVAQHPNSPADAARLAAAKAEAQQASSEAYKLPPLLRPYQRPGSQRSASQAYSHAVLADGPTAFFQFNDPGGATTFIDSTGHGTSAQARGSVPLVGPGPLGPQSQAASLAPTSEVVVHPLAALQGDHPRTTELWFRTTVKAQQCLLGAGANSHGRAFSLCLTNGQQFGAPPPNAPGVYLQTYDADVYVPSPSLTDGGWHYLAVTLSGSSVRVVIDGQTPQGLLWNGAAYSSPTAQPLKLAFRPNTAASAVTIGAAAWAPSFSGEISEVAVYPQALSPETLAMHASGAGLVAGTGQVRTVPCPLPPSLLRGIPVKPAPIPSVTTLPRSLPLPSGAAVYATSAPGAGVIFLLAPSGYSCEPLFGSGDGGLALTVSAPSKRSYGVTATFQAGGIGLALDLPCTFIPGTRAVDQKLRGPNFPCPRPPAQDTVTQLPTGSRDLLAAAVRSPAGVNLPSLTPAGARDAPALAVYTGSASGNGGFSQASSCTLSTAERRICAASLAYFITQSQLAKHISASALKALLASLAAFTAS